jgi:pilus assembly protein CpaB
MDRRFLTVLGVSLLFALVISSVFYQMTARSKGTSNSAQSDMKDIVLAARPLGLGITVKPADVKIGRVPAATFPKGAFSKPEEVVDRPVTSSILVD